MSAVGDKVAAIVAERLRWPSPVSPEARFLDDLKADSLDVVELVIAVEDEFGIELPDDDCDRVATVAELAALVEAKVAARTAA